MHLANIDYIANSGESPFHKARTSTKIFFTICMLTAIIISKNILALLSLVGLLLILFLFTRVPLKSIAYLAMYPLFFSLLFALIMVQQSLTMGVIVILKAVGAALTMIFLITTTPYTGIFGFLSLFLPPILVDIFIFTYRSLFILLDKAENLFKSIRLRGGYSPIKLLLNFKNTSNMIGNLLVNSFDMAERMSKIYMLRGYHGKIPISEDFLSFQKIDIAILLLSAAILMGTVVMWSQL